MQAVASVRECTLLCCWWVGAQEAGHTIFGWGGLFGCRWLAAAWCSNILQGGMVTGVVRLRVALVAPYLSTHNGEQHTGYPSIDVSLTGSKQADTPQCGSRAHCFWQH